MTKPQVMNNIILFYLSESVYNKIDLLCFKTSSPIGKEWWEWCFYKKEIGGKWAMSVDLQHIVMKMISDKSEEVCDQLNQWEVENQQLINDKADDYI